VTDGAGGFPRHGTANPPRLRVCLVLGTSSGGIGAHVRMLASGLAARGARVTVLGPASVREAFGLGGLPGVLFETVDVGDRPRPGDVRSVLRLRRLLPRAGDAPDGDTTDVDGPDVVVHAHGLRAGALCVLARAGLPGMRRPALAVTVHNAPPAGRGPAALVYRVLERAVAAGADLVLCVSSDLEQRMRDAGARRVARAVVPAPEGTLPATAAPAPAAGPPGDPGPPIPRRPVVLAVGRLAPQKGLGTLLAAAASWGDMHPVPRVVIAGEGPLLGQLRNQAAMLGVDAEFLGHRDDVPVLLAGADVFVLPSHWEGQPLVLQEALRAGAAIVAARTGGIPELVGPGAAYLVSPGDAAQLAAGVRAILADRELAGRLRTAALRRAASLPAQGDAVSAALESYSRVVPGASPAPGAVLKFPCNSRGT
jgi:glycosyltransferase involved in cell wall biosynthesis